jgi:hypothetical protein
MNTIRFVQNGRGEREVEAVNSTQGLSLFNASGDISDQSTGFKYAIDTMAFIKAEVTKQKFYTVPFADIIPTAVGRGNWSDQIFTNVSFSNAGPFAQGFIDTGLNTRFAGVDAAVAQKSQYVRTWAKQLTYSIVEVQQALQANNWDPIMAKANAIKENYDLGIQALAFNGVTGDTQMTGLLNNAGVTIDSTTISKKISAMSAAELATLVQALIASYYLGLTPFTTDMGANITAMPDTFVMPLSDFLGLATPFPGTVGTYPLPMIDYLEMAFKKQTQNPNFKIVPVAYCESQYSVSGTFEYCLFRKDPRSLMLELPIGFTTTQANTLNNFNFQSVAYARVAGVGVFRNAEVRYYHHA